MISISSDSQGAESKNQSINAQGEFLVWGAPESTGFVQYGMKFGEPLNVNPERRLDLLCRLRCLEGTYLSSASKRPNCAMPLGPLYRLRSERAKLRER